MGSFFGGLGSAIGGTAPGAAAYGHQVREQLEARRGALAQMIGQMAQNTADPSTRSELYGHLSDLYGNKQMGQILPGLVKTIQNHSQDTQKLVSLIPPPQKPQPQPGPAQPGQTPGTPAPQTPVTGMEGLIAGAQQLAPHAETVAPQSAAQPTANPTQPSGPISLPAPPPQQAPPPVASEDTLYQPGTTERGLIDQWKTAAGAPGGPPAWLTNEATGLMSKEAEYHEKQALNQYALKIGPQRAEALKQMADQLKAQYPTAPDWLILNHASTLLGLPPVNMPFSMVNPIHENGMTGAEFNRRWPDMAQKSGVPDNDSPVDVLLDKMTHQPTFVNGKAVAQKTTPGAGGALEAFNPYNPGAGTTPVPGAVASSTAPKTKTGSSTKIVDINGMMTPVPTPSSSTTTVGGPSASGTRLKGSTGGGAGGTSVRIGQPLGQSQSTFKMSAENPLTPAGQQAIAEAQPVMQQLNRAQAMLESIKDDNMPFTTAPARLGYAVGMASDYSNLINNLEMGKVIGAARVLKGSSRAIQALNIAMKHLPDPAKDSPKLMYEKIQNIKQNLADIQTAAATNERRYPGMPEKSGQPAGVTPVKGQVDPSKMTDEELLKALMSK